MIAGLRGSLLSHEALERASPQLLASGAKERERDAARRAFRPWILRACAELGPASGPRAIYDRIAAPLAAMLGYQPVLVDPRSTTCERLYACLTANGSPVASMLVTSWEACGGGVWRDAVRQALRVGSGPAGGGWRWCLCVSGTTVRVFDAERTYSRRHVEIDLAVAANDPGTFGLLWGLFRAGPSPGQGAGFPMLDLAVRLCDEHRDAVRGSLQHGVHEALASLLDAFVAAGSTRRVARRRARVPSGVEGPASSDVERLFDESLVVIYRILFLLFAEARGLVPHWHPIYRDSYTIESLRAPAETRPRPRGIWEALQAIARLAHRGCRAGTLNVPPFNGRLFSPAHAPLADSVPLDDGAVRRALVSLTTRPSRRGLERISYADLGVEQLGGVYERILDFTPEIGSGVTLVRAERRKSTGSFYTPRALTEFLVRRALAPLVHEASPERILELRVLDPAMGSGAFLVAACRYLSVAYEAALVRGGLSCGDFDDRDRAGFRRTIAQRCLFGVDANPMAVQLGRLSLWLATLASDRPLTFLDHHLRSGNSLVGASLADLVRDPFGARRNGGRRPGPGRPNGARPLPLFDDEALDEALRTTVGPRLSIAAGPGDTLDQVRAKERLLGRIDADDGPLARWKQVAHMWCARWFPAAPEDSGAAARVRALRRASVFHGLADAVLGRGASLPEHVAAPLLAEARTAAGRERFFHWTLEFPEVFFAPDGRPLDRGGFDAVLGNPPWEMLRGDRGAAEARRRAGAAAGRLAEFARGSGIYRLQSGGHANLFQLFLERALTLVRAGGRLGLVLPSGFAGDHGCAALRRHVLDRTLVDTFVSIENRDGLFPIHRGLRFLLLCASAGGSTTTIPVHAGIRSADALDRLPDAGPGAGVVALPRPLVERFTGPQLAIPDIRGPLDVAIVSKVAGAIPPLGSAEGWHARFGRELNASDDGAHFTASPLGLPVIDGKHLQPFAVDLARTTRHVTRATARRLLPEERTFGRARLAYRDVAAATNRLTLIAAIVPRGVVTTHTLFCLKEPADDAVQWFLCGVFNSFVANYLVRLRVNTHVTTSIVEQLPVPAPASSSTPFEAVVALARTLARTPADAPAAARLQALVARLYGLSDAEFEHVLATFPLIAPESRAEALRQFRIDERDPKSQRWRRSRDR
jgi:hypothetical protein